MCIRDSLRISPEGAGLGPQDQVVTHAGGRRIPDAVVVLGAVGVGVEVAGAGVPCVLEQFDQVEGVADAFASKAEVLVLSLIHNLDVYKRQV